MQGTVTVVVIVDSAPGYVGVPVATEAALFVPLFSDTPLLPLPGTTEGETVLFSALLVIGVFSLLEMIWDPPDAIV